MLADLARGGSLQARLIVLLSSVVLLVWVIGGLLIYVQSRTQSDELADRELRETGLLLLSLAQHEILEHGGPFSEFVSPAAEAHAHYMVFQIWDNTGRIVYRSAGATGEPLVPLETVGFSQRIADGEEWRTFSAWDDQRRLLIQVGETEAHRHAINTTIFSQLGLMMSFLLPLTIALIWVIVGRVLAPLEASAREVAARSPDDLREVRAADAPTEVRPLLEALNQLLARMRAALERERTFTADAAHELRTPLAAIRTTAQVLGDARSPEDVQSSVKDLLDGVDRGSRLVDQLLVMARMDARHRGGRRPTDLQSLVLSECEAHQRAARERAITLEVDARPTMVNGDEDRLRILLRNLVDNAIRYTPAGGRVRLASGVGPAGPELVVSDSGVGIAVEDRQRVFERFFRAMGNDEPGSGLGLAIVQQVAADHHARVELRDGLDGAGVTFAVVFPPGAQPS